jgi:hypothetical protein
VNADDSTDASVSDELGGPAGRLGRDARRGGLRRRAGFAGGAGGAGSEATGSMVAVTLVS